MTYKNVIANYFYTMLHGYNHEKYWKRRDYVTGAKKCSLLWRFYCLIYCRRTEVKQGAFLSTRYVGGSTFITPPPSASWSVWNLHNRRG